MTVARRAIGSLLAATLLVTGAPVLATEPERDADLSLPACGRAVPVARVLATGVDRFTGAAGSNGDAVLIGALPAPMLGTVAFVRVRGVWKAYAVEAQGAPQGVYRASDGTVFVWSMLSTEGPGPRFQGMAITRRGKRFCTEIRFPAGLNQPQWANEYLELTGFNMTHAGQGILAGRPSDGPLRRWFYVYTTRDGGRHWSAPKRRVTLPATPGAYREIPIGQASAGLIASLRRR